MPSKPVVHVMKRCPKCDGTRVQELLAGWFWANDPREAPDELALAELYTAKYWCDDCDDHPDELVEDD